MKMIAVTGATFVSRFGFGDTCPGIGAAISDIGETPKGLTVKAIPQPHDSLMNVNNKSLNVAVYALGFPGNGGDKRLQAQASHDIFQGGVFPGARRRIRRNANLAAFWEILAFDLSQAQSSLRQGMQKERTNVRFLSASAVLRWCIAFRRHPSPLADACLCPTSPT